MKINFFRPQNVNELIEYQELHRYRVMKGQEIAIWWEENRVGYLNAAIADEVEHVPIADMDVLDEIHAVEVARFQWKWN